MKLQSQPQSSGSFLLLRLIPAALPTTLNFARAPAAAPLSLLRLLPCFRRDDLPQPCPVLPLSPLLSLRLTSSPLPRHSSTSLPRRSPGKRASRLLTQTWAIVNLSLALLLGQKVWPPPVPGYGVLLGDSLERERAVAADAVPGTSREAVKEEASLCAGNILVSPGKVFLGECCHPQPTGQ